MRIDNDEVTSPLPPETTTSMPPCLWYAYNPWLGWPARPEDFRQHVTRWTLPDPALAFRRWIRG